MAAGQWCIGMVHFLEAASIARYTTFNAGASLGKSFRLWMALRMTLFNDSIALVVEWRQRVGDWEGDTVLGTARRNALLTLVERKTLFTVITRLSGKRADLLAAAAIPRRKPWQAKIKTITFDNGLEFAQHAAIARRLEADIYFAHPYASWERGSNENTNGLIRQYFPKGTDFNNVSDEEISRVMARLNNRPRKSRGGRSPNELFLGQRVDLLAA